MAICLDYNELGKLEQYAKKAAEAAGSYAKDLKDKCSGKFDSLTGGSSTYTTNASYYIDAKIKALEEKKQSLSDLSTQLQTICDTAKRVDGEVKTSLMDGQNDFYKLHEEPKIDDWKAALINWFTDLKNSNPLFEMIGNLFSTISLAASDILAELRYWYECEGGKEVVAFALAILGAVVAVLLFIAAFPASTFFAICAAIGAALTMVNAITNIFTSYAALKAAKDGDPAWAKIYGDQNKLSDVLRQNNFNNNTLNRLSNIMAMGLDITEFVVGVINFAHGVSEIKSKFTCINNYFSKNNGGLFTYFKEAEWHEVLDWDADGHAIGTKWEMVTNDQGIVQTKFTLRSIWNGVKSFAMNKPVTPNSDQGLRTVLNQNFAVDFKTEFKTIFSPQSWKDTFRYNITDGGRNDYEIVKKTYSWQGFKETFRYNMKNAPIKGLMSGKNVPAYAKIVGGEVNSFKSGISTIEQIATGKYDFLEEFKGKISGTSDFHGLYEKGEAKVDEFTKLFSNGLKTATAIGG